jgi:hypothetical protein
MTRTRRFFRSLWLTTVGTWLAAGVIAINLAAIWPRGIQDPDTTNTTPFDYALNTICLIMTVALIASAGHPKLKSWTATASGGIWFGFAGAGLLAYWGQIEIVTLLAYILFPLGVSFCSFALARTADLERRAGCL